MIYINDKLRISKIDENCLQLEVFREVVSKKTKQSSFKWQWCGYYGSVKDALVGALKKSLYNCTENELEIKSVISRINAAEKSIIAAIEQIGK